MLEGTQEALPMEGLHLSELFAGCRKTESDGCTGGSKEVRLVTFPVPFIF